MNKISKTERKMEQTLGREVAAEEIAKELHMTTEEVERMQSYIKNPVSLETPVGDEEDSNLEDFIEDTQEPTPEEAVAALVQKEEVQEMLSTLTEKEQKILRLRYGLEDGNVHTLEETGQILGVDQRTDPSAGVKSIGKTEEISRTKSIKRKKFHYIKY